MENSSTHYNKLYYVTIYYSNTKAKSHIFMLERQHKFSPLE